MSLLKHKQIKKTFILTFKRKEKGLRVTTTFVKLTLIFMLSALGLNVSAQQTKMQGDIAVHGINASPMKIGNYEWYVAKHAKNYNGKGIDYTLLISRAAGTMNFSKAGTTDGNQYPNSELRTYIRKEYNSYAGNYGEIPSIAVVPTLGSYTSTTDATNPTAVLASSTAHPNNTDDIFFAPSYKDVCDWGNTTGPTLGTPISGLYAQGIIWWTRTSHGTDRVYTVNSSGGSITDAQFFSGTEYIVIGVWVRTTAISYPVSGKIKGVSNASNQVITYSIDNGNPTTTKTNGSGEYTINVPYGSSVKITPPGIPGHLFYPDSYTVSNVKSSVTNRDFTYYNIGFTVNNEVYLAVDGKSYCNTADFTFETDQNAPNIAWELTRDAVIIQESTSAVFSVSSLQDGYYTITLTAGGQTYTTHFAVGHISIVWTGAVLDNDWHNQDNWTPTIVPSACSDVYIPGNLDYYPLLNDADHNTGKIAECRNIYFIFGSELGRPDLLTYEKAFVQYNFDLKDANNKQQKDPDKNLVINSNSTTDRLKFSAAVSATPMERERWYMLSAPLKEIVTGDFGFGGFPLTFLKKFGPIDKDNVNYPVGTWTTPYNSMDELVANNVTDGFAYFMYGLGYGTSDLGCDESGVFGQLNELDFMPFRGGGNKHYGLKETNGILELPSFADSTKLYAHRTQLYNGIDKSTFFYINGNSGNIITPAQSPDLVDRSESNYRFAPEIYDPSLSKWVFQPKITNSINELAGDGNEYLAGNPYMSSLDMLEFFRYGYNNYNLYNSFRIWNGEDFISCEINISSGDITSASPADMRYVSPLQGFLLKTKYGGFFEFEVKTMSTVRPTGSAFNLRSNQETVEENLLRIKSENGEATSYAVIRCREGASNGYNDDEDVQKLFSPLGYVPSIYSLAGETPVDINFINDRGDIIVPLGIKTDRTGEISLTFTGMDNYLKATKIELIDALENRIVDLTGKSSYTYIFDHKEKGIKNGRFSLKISSSLTHIPDVKNSNNLEVYGDSKGIYIVSSEPVQKLEVFDFVGRKLYENNSNARYYPLPDNLSKSPVIVKVVANNITKTVKVN